MLTTRNAVLTLAAMAFVMGATRFPGLGSNLHLQDASWALFFLAGFYLAAQWRWAFPALMAVAVTIDLIAIRYYGVSNYCVTLAYWFLVPSYGALWFGGSWLGKRVAIDRWGAAKLAGSSWLSTSVCFAISNGSFYWLSDRVADPSWHGWVANFAAWYWPFVSIAMAYIGFAALIHVLFAKLPQLRSARAQPRNSRAVFRRT